MGIGHWAWETLGTWGAGALSELKLKIFQCEHAQFPIFPIPESALSAILFYQANTIPWGTQYFKGPLS
ncbi:MAG: hypothetical protein F6J93_02095 [Oscillatoria sp. SIO1A7]|nr:hypothetical protein [Oscillatoria sp. SIO1A7]